MRYLTLRHENARFASELKIFSTLTAAIVTTPPENPRSRRLILNYPMFIRREKQTATRQRRARREKPLHNRFVFLLSLLLGLFFGPSPRFGIPAFNMYISIVLICSCFVGKLAINIILCAAGHSNFEW